ncbi:MAG: hypothetical protein AB7O68_10945 [Pirellulales bacterium]
MSKRKTDRRRSTAKASGGAVGSPADVLTVGWMLTVITVVACEVGWLATLGAGLAWPAAAAPRALGAVLLLAALLSWLIAMGLLPVVLKLREEPPPASIVWFSVGLGALPLGVMVARVLG